MKLSAGLLKSASALLGAMLVAAMPSSGRAAACHLGNGIEHVVYVEFDNVHFTRDNPNVPSDLEQMPNLLNFLASNGTLDAGDHAVLISHTANDILTTQTGLYSDDTGIFIANSFGVFGPASASNPNGVYFPSSFFYWTDLVSDITPATADGNFALTTPGGLNVPAPWVPFTRAGCDVGAFSTANIVLERTPFDVVKVFGAGSTQAGESTSQQTTDFIGESIHCALGSSVCTTANGAVNDLLPDEPGGYSGYQALFGAKYVAPALLGPGGQFQDLNGNKMNGFPGFDPTASQTLGVVATMLEKGVPVVFAYIADAHDNEEGSSLSSEDTFGPGEAPYVRQLADYNAAFGTFFARLAKEGITPGNTLFVFTPDEGDHFVGGAPTPANCDGAKITTSGGVTAVTPDVACTYGPKGVGELDINLNGLVANAGDATPFSIHFDDAPTVYVAGEPDRDDSSVRKLEQTMAGLSAVNPHNGNSESLLGTGLGPNLQGAIVDSVAQRLLHMDTQADPNRSPTFTFFGNPNFFFESVGSTTPAVGAGFAWNHGDIQPEIARTFIGIAGPGVRNLGITQPQDFFTDHVDVRPTIMALTGLVDDYAHDGRAILEVINPSALPSALASHHATSLRLGQALKQIDAPFGQLAMATLKLSTTGLTSNSPNDFIYGLTEAIIDSWRRQRDDIAGQIKNMLEGAEFHGDPINEGEAASLIIRAQVLVAEAQAWSNIL